MLIKSSFYRLYMYKYAVNIMKVPEIIERGNLIIERRNLIIERGNLIIERIRIRAESGSGGVRRYGILPYFCTPGSVL